MGYDPRYIRGIEEFNRGDYFAAHELIEDYWLEADGADREFYQAVIQAAVALHHLHSANPLGARKVWATCRRHFEPFRPRHAGIDIDGLLRKMEPLFERDTPPDPADLPTIDLDPDGP